MLLIELDRSILYFFCYSVLNKSVLFMPLLFYLQCLSKQIQMYFTRSIYWLHDMTQTGFNELHHRALLPRDVPICIAYFHKDNARVSFESFQVKNLIKPNLRTIKPARFIQKPSGQTYTIHIANCYCCNFLNVWIWKWIILSITNAVTRCLD